MAKALRVAAIVVGVAALAATGVGLAIGAGTIIAAGVSVGTLATALSLGAGLLSLAAGVLTKKPKVGSSGQQLDFVADPTAGQPYYMGAGMTGAYVIHEASWGEKNKWLGIVGALSCAGPIFSYDGLYADMTHITFTGRNANGYYTGYMLQSYQLGARPEAVALDMSSVDGTMPDWSAASRLSGLAAIGLVLKADVDNGKIYSGGVPKLTSLIHGVLAYDPRQDSTNGGSGVQRALDEATYGYSDNPWVHHGTFALGRWVNGKRVIGPGLPTASIDWASHVEAANVADANGWTISGRVTSSDKKWEVLKAIAQAGGGYPIPNGAQLSCLVNTPRVSLETINEEDLRGAVSAPQMGMRRSRFFGGVARFRSPEHAWEIVPLDAVRNATYLAADRDAEKTTEVEYGLVADKDQAAQLIGYEVANSRERAPITLELGLYWSQYKTGDCLTLNVPSANLVNQKCVVIGRQYNPASNTVTFQFRTEDDAKHTWALGLVGSAPPPTTVIFAPGAGDAGQFATSTTQTILRSTYTNDLALSAVDNGGGTATVTFGPNPWHLDYATTPPVQVAIAQSNKPGLANATTYYAYCDVTAPGDAAPVIGLTTVFNDALNSTAHPLRVYLGRKIITPISGGAATGGADLGGGYGACVTTDAQLLMANADHASPGETKPIGQARVGEWVWTQHEDTLEWGAFPIVAAQTVERPVFRATVNGNQLRASKDHRVHLDGRWQFLHEMGEADGTAQVVQLTVQDAHTYFANGVLSHNIKP